VPRQLYGNKLKNRTASKEEREQEAQEQVTTEHALEAGHERLAEAADIILPSRPVALAELPLDSIIPSRAQARRPESLTPESLLDLVASMKTHGLLSRIRVRQVEGSDERFELVFGERRWRAARQAGFTHYPVEIASYTDDELAEIGLIENIQRKDLSPLEEAEKYRQLLALTDAQGQPKYSIRKLAERIGKDKGYIEDRLAVLRAPDDVQQLVQEQPEVPLRVARELTKVEKAEDRAVLIEQVRAGNLRRDDVRAVVKEVKEQAKRTPPVVHMAEPASPAALVKQSVKQSETEPAAPTVPAAPAVPVDPGPPPTAMAHILFEQTLRRDDEAIQKILFRLLSTIETLSEAEREVLLGYIDRWARSLQALKQHMHSQESQ
jgi:ParB family transcriptional regulator, chromosome partitioning protein